MRPHDTGPQLPTSGPLLTRLIEAQRTAEGLLSYPSVQEAADALVRHCKAHRWPLLWPAGPAAERLVGAAILAGAGRVRARGWTDPVDGQSVLVVDVGAVTAQSILQCADHARALGASEVCGCGLNLADVGDLDGLDGYTALTVPPSLSRTLKAA